MSNGGFKLQEGNGPLTEQRSLTEDVFDVNQRVATLEGSHRTLVGMALGAAALLFATLGIAVTVMIFEVEDTKEQVHLSEQRVTSHLDKIERDIGTLPDRLTAILSSIFEAYRAGQGDRE